MVDSISDKTELSNGVKMPWLGLGVYKVEEGREVEHAVEQALAAGYRSIDTAALYGNEAGVGKAVGNSGISREELFVTTKVWNSRQGYESTLLAFEESRQKLGLEYIDLYLVHWPVQGKYKDTWRALEKLHREGYIRAIGVSNFQIHHLKDLLSVCEVKPTVNQVELHPLLTQKELLKFCRQHDIQMEAWSPLMRGRLDHPLLKELGEKYGKTPAQIVLRWDLQNGVVVIPKSVRAERIRENADIFDFELSSEDLTKLDGMNENRRFGPDPDHIDF
ncbi:aldo/keto reductase [Ferviditalea candida]|uniref:Aldo/keto reductase n=1 Tax=Ferviditalea candida TaxID=3108399 RepID=A0ABU5ZHE5_9BACL|nr:aldo/keto reductase [Paenibacillaceae bacterium T2]